MIQLTPQNIFLLTLLLISSYTDIKYMKIYNRVIFLFFFLGITASLATFSYLSLALSIIIFTSGIFLQTENINGLNAGDIKLISVSILFFLKHYALTFLFVLSLVYVLVFEIQKIRKIKKLPFAPFILLSAVITIMR